jgi:hypothetical protein
MFFPSKLPFCIDHEPTLKEFTTECDLGPRLPFFSPLDLTFLHHEHAIPFSSAVPAMHSSSSNVLTFSGRRARLFCGTFLIFSPRTYRTAHVPRPFICFYFNLFLVGPRFDISFLPTALETTSNPAKTRSTASSADSTNV